MARFSFARAATVYVLLAGAFALLTARVYWLQTGGREQTLRQADRQHHRRESLPARRGSIYDRNGIEMAGTVQTQAVFVDPKFMLEVAHEDPKGLITFDANLAKLADLVGRDAFELSETISMRYNDRFVKIAENVDDATCQRVRALDIPGVGTTPSDVRFYPMGSTASHILGGAGHDGRGLEGIELKFEKLLAGRDGEIRSRKDAQHRAINVAEADYKPPVHGQHLMLTIDASIQLIAEQELSATCRQFKAARGEVVVLDPRTGEVLALANWPAYHPQNLVDTLQTPEIRRNNALVAPYEPGSTIKPFIAGPALKWKLTRVDEVWPIKGLKYRTPYGRTITDVYGYGPLTTWDGLVKSSNILMSMLGERMGNRKLHTALTEFGFGSATGVELPGEDPGRVLPLKHWTKYSTESVAQGYELMVTPLQLARAFAVYANGGKLVKPTIIRGTLNPAGQVVSRQELASLRMMPEVLSPLTAAEMKRVLTDVPVRGTASRARSPIWNVFGKTGTAHISQGKKGYSDSKYTSSFLCGAPAESPQVVVAFIIHEPDKSLAHFGGTVSAPGAVKMIERILAYQQIPPSPELQPPPAHIQPKLVNFDPKVYRQRDKVVAAVEAHD